MEENNRSSLQRESHSLKCLPKTILPIGDVLPQGTKFLKINRRRAVLIEHTCEYEFRATSRCPILIETNTPSLHTYLSSSEWSPTERQTSSEFFLLRQQIELLTGLKALRVPLERAS